MFIRFLAYFILATFPSVAFAGDPPDEWNDSTLIVKSIAVFGNEKTKEFIILREISLRVGEKLTEETIEHDKKRIYDLGLFTKVEIEYAVEGDQAIVAVVVHERWYLFPFPILGIKYRNPKYFFYGAGLSHQNFRGRNEKLWGSFALGFDRWVQVGYQNPKLTGDDDLFLRSFLSRGEVRSLSTTDELYDQKLLTAQLTIGKRFGLYQTISGWMNYDVWQVSEVRFGRTASHTGRDAFATLGLRYTVDTRDLREYPTSGSYVSAFVAKYGISSGAIDFFKYGYDVRAFSLMAEDLTIGGRTFGTFVGGGIVPPYRREFFGYDNRIRGYFNNVFEGEMVLGHSVEFRYPLLKPRYYVFPYSLLPEFSLWRYGLYVGLFADAGKVWFRGEPLSTRGWRSGVGGGLHFLLPYSIVVRTEYAVNNRGTGQFVLDFGVSF